MGRVPVVLAYLTVPSLVWVGGVIHGLKQLAAAMCAFI